MRNPMRATAAAVLAVLTGGAVLVSGLRAAPSLDVTYQPDGARVIARWSAVCDWRGCPDAFRVTWTRGTVEVVTRTVPGRADTATLVLPPVGDSVRVAVSVVALRRGQASAAKTATTWLRTPDAPPPAVDSLALDTLAFLAEYDLPILQRTVTGAAGPLTMVPGDSAQLCAFARRKATGELVTLVDATVSDAEEERIVAACESARRAVQAERGG
jgi:hypothetical protein